MIMRATAAMMIAMLVATAFGIHEETSRIRQEAKIKATAPFGRRR